MKLESRRFVDEIDSEDRSIVGTRECVFHGQLNCVADLFVLHCVETPSRYEISGRKNKNGIKGFRRFGDEIEDRRIVDPRMCFHRLLNCVADLFVLRCSKTSRSYKIHVQGRMNENRRFGDEIEDRRTVDLRTGFPYTIELCCRSVGFQKHPEGTKCLVA